MAVLMIVLLVLGALVSRFMWINELNTGVEEMKREAEDIARNYEDLSDYQITTRVFVSCINEIALDSSVWLVDRNGLQLNVTGLDASTPDLTSEDVQKYMQVVLQSGEPMTIQGGFDSYFGKNAVITVAMPLSSRGETVGAVFIHKRLELFNTGVCAPVPGAVDGGHACEPAGPDPDRVHRRASRAPCASSRTPQSSSARGT